MENTKVKVDKMVWRGKLWFHPDGIEPKTLAYSEVVERLPIELDSTETISLQNACHLSGDCLARCSEDGKNWLLYQRASNAESIGYFLATRDVIDVITSLARQSLLTPSQLAGDRLRQISETLPTCGKLAEYLFNPDLTYEDKALKLKKVKNYSIIMQDKWSNPLVEEMHKQNMGKAITVFMTLFDPSHFINYYSQKNPAEAHIKKLSDADLDNAPTPNFGGNNEAILIACLDFVNRYYCLEFSTDERKSLAYKLAVEIYVGYHISRVRP